ncbi:inorganic pyrophosphatase [Fervidicella metallireducens AeB]|uniref:inorganic diphosphatase n=1 Tax=Fervidicella metallireducens AeB TaxID=1403537 RepID=A0A017RVE4_9CLOT|nr:putative manganese-dependent inorganic diphosphatase [Fervidicella metallireducens]EYE88389.1 inorganic pyrophosphatase [Fervidicella metallireducens AeB]
MGDVIYITGHRNPDSDSICSALAYADLKKKLGYNAIAARLGEISRETEFILDYFNLKKPEYLPTVKIQVCDLEMDNVEHVYPHTSIKEAWTIMNKGNYKTLPVVDSHKKLLGVVSLTDITFKYMDTQDVNVIATSKTPLKNIIETLNAKILCGSEEDFKTSGKVIIAALKYEQMKSYVNVGDIVIIGNRTDSQVTAIEQGANLLIVTGGCDVEENVLKLCKEKKCIVISTPNDTFTTARLINQSIPLNYVMTSNDIIKFELDDLADEAKEVMTKTRHSSYPVVDTNNHIKGFISRYHLITQKKKKVILMDHNETAQSVHGIEDAEVIEIIDHHRVADVQTSKPIYFRNEPVGSTSTIVANMFFENGLTPEKGIAGALLGAIISDTLKFKSPTCTNVDKVTAEKLASIAEVDIDTFAYEMFKAGTSLKGKTPEEIFYQDYKDFNLGEYKIGVGQVNTMDPSSIEETKSDLLAFMNNVCKTGNYNLVIIMVTDIVNEGSELLFVGENKELISKAFNVELGENSVYLPGVVSRKKQIIPPLSQATE